MAAQRTLGINGIGRIGKLTLWHHLGRDDFDRFVVNTGRPVGTSLDSVVQYLSKDSHLRPAPPLPLRPLRRPRHERRGRGARPHQRLRQGDRHPARGAQPQGHPVARQRRGPGRGRHRHVPRPARRGGRAARRPARPPGGRRRRRRPELAVQEQAEDARRCRRTRRSSSTASTTTSSTRRSTRWCRPRRARPPRWRT